MSTKKRVLFLTQEMSPYTDLSEISALLKILPLFTQDNGMEIRVLMPRFGSINERRHRLHEVVRLSGMNIIIDDDDYPLIIKVASLPGARLQVYFLDNEEFFKRKFVFEDGSKKLYEDNQERMIFFCKGAVETVRKFGWAPDVIHCHGWMTSLVPLYLRTAYKDDPLFKKSKIIYSLYNESLESNFKKDFFTKASINNLEPKDLEAYQNADGDVSLHKGAIKYSDALIQGPKDLDAALAKEAKASKKQLLPHQEPDNLLQTYFDLYKELMG
jgi:starch synthase